MSPALSAAARLRLGSFSVGVWVVGLVLIVIIGAATLTQLPYEMNGRRNDAYRYEPWLNPSPSVATDEGGGVYSGRDGDVIRLSGVDPAQPLVLRRLDHTSVFDVVVTGPDGPRTRATTPPRFADWDYGTMEMYVVAPGVDAEIWVDAPSDETWRMSVAPASLPVESGVVSGAGPRSFVIEGGAPTARVSGRGSSYVSVTVVTTSGSDMVLGEAGRFDRSIAWADSPVTVFVVDTGKDGAWSIDLGPPAPAASASTSPTPAPSASDPSPSEEEASHG